MPKMTVTPNDGRFIADFEIGDVDPIDDQPEIDEVLREAFESEGAAVPDWLQRDDVRPGADVSRISSRSTIARREGPHPWESAVGRV